MEKISIILPIDINLETKVLFYLLSSLKRNRYIAFLDSSLTPNKYSLFSYIAIKPDFIVECSKGFNRLRIMKSFYQDSDQSYKKLFEDNLKFLLENDHPCNSQICLNNMHPLDYLRKTFNSNINEENKKIFIKDLSELSIKNIKTLIESKEPKNAGSGTCNSVKSNDRDFLLPDFIGGFIGYLSYDLKNFIESLPQTSEDDMGIPLYQFMYFSHLIAFDHINKKWLQIHCYKNILNNNNMKRTIDLIKEDIKRIEKSILKEIKVSINNIAETELKNEPVKKFDKNKSSNLNVGSGNLIERAIEKKYMKRRIGRINLNPNLSRNDYIKAVVKARRYIHDGEIYQANITQRFSCTMDVEPFDLYYILREKNSAPFSAYLSFDELKIGCSSPERFLFMKNNNIHTRPIKGTRPRGKNRFEDKKYLYELTHSIKDRAELNMIVDLERNDLGKFCRYSTVEVSEHAVAEEYARVFHLVSTVQGMVKEGYDIIDILKATFPGGSITGAPKIRAMEIIDELEPTARNIYTGSIGYIGVDSSMDLNIVIRTFIIKGNNFYYNVGGGIVEDSIPQSEYQETLDKGLALKETLDYFTYNNLSGISRD